jgi:hypothetical protein
LFRDKDRLARDEMESARRSSGGWGSGVSLQLMNSSSLPYRAVHLSSVAEKSSHSRRIPARRVGCTQQRPDVTALSDCSDAMGVTDAGPNCKECE